MAEICKQTASKQSHCPKQFLTFTYRASSVQLTREFEFASDAAAEESGARAACDRAKVSAFRLLITNTAIYINNKPRHCGQPAIAAKQ